MDSTTIAPLAGAAAQASAFAATVPLLPYGATPRTIRAALALTLIPLCLTGAKSWPVSSSLFSHVMEQAAVGAGFGLAAAVLAGAVIAAGNAIDAALGSPGFSVRTGGEGPISRLYQMAFAIVFLGSGGLESMVARFVADGSGVPHHTLNWLGLNALVRASVAASLALAGPSLFSQAIATIVAGVFARAAPQINGVLFSAPLASAGVLLALAAGASVLWSELAELAHRAAAVFWNPLS